MNSRLLFLFLFFILGCQKEHAPLDAKDFRNLLIDIHRTDATLAINRGQDSGNELKNYEYYNEVFNRYGISRADFDSCMIYYSAKTKEFSKMYDYVIDSLNKELTAATAVMNKLRENDSVQLFPIADTIYFDSCYNHVDVTVDSIVPGLYKFSTFFQFDTIDSGKNNRIEAFFLTKNQKDTLHVRDVRVMTDTIKRRYSWQQYADSTFSTLHIRYVMCDNLKKLKYRSGKSWETNLFRPYISKRSEDQFKRSLDVLKRYDKRKK